MILARATWTASRRRADLRDAGKGDGRHGFNVSVPSYLADGKAHTVELRVAGSNVTLKTRVVQATENAAQATGATHEGGSINMADGNVITGWAWDRDRPDDPVEVEVFDGDTSLGIVTVKEFRIDLLKAGKGNGEHGFSFELPNSIRDGQSHALHARIKGTEIELAKPRTVQVAP